MRLIKFNEFANSGLELHYCCFDWDDNLLHMSTVIHMEKLVDGEWIPTDVSTSEFAKVRNDSENYRLAKEAFSEFRDVGPRGDSAFIEDTKNALSHNQFGPAWPAFIKCLTEGSIFAIITARGHEPKSIRRSVEYIIDNTLTEDEQFLLYSNCLKHSYIFNPNEEFSRIPRGELSQTPLVKIYLDNCDFYGVSSDSFEARFGKTSAAHPEKAKESALELFIDKCNKLGEKVGAKSVSIGFSDDDSKNVEHVHKFFKEKSALSNDLTHKLKLNLYDTTDRELKGGVRTKYHEAAGSSIAPGMGSSVMPFTQFNNMSNRLFTSPEDGPNKSAKFGSEQLAKMSKEFTNDRRIKKRKKKVRQVGIRPMDDKFFLLQNRQK